MSVCPQVSILEQLVDFVENAYGHYATRGHHRLILLTFYTLGSNMAQTRNIEEGLTIEILNASSLSDLK
jgi:hypothetical protein